ncbi:MAG: hypothetical protein KCHDKBKB_03097 [Elusimicrobia bacterium]|nr:hypothetical protein [Elusimicrobiota bacterium]
MLETYANFLNSLNESSPNDLKDRVTLRLQFSAKPKEVERCAQDVRDLILSMPSISEKIHSWLKNPSISTEDKRLIFDLTGYLHHPLDVIPHRHTLFAYLEDAYMTGYVFKRLFEINEALRQSASEEVSQWRDHLPIWLTHAKKVMPYEARKMERMVDEIINSKLSLACPPNTQSERDETLDRWAETPAVQKGVSTRERLESVISTLRGDQNYNPPLSGQYAAA